MSISLRLLLKQQNFAITFLTWCVFIDPSDLSHSAFPNVSGRNCFNHEAVAFDTFGNAYLTEDRSDGSFYKYTPSKKGDLNKGQLFALAIRNQKGI